MKSTNTANGWNAYSKAYDTMRNIMATIQNQHMEDRFVYSDINLISHLEDAIGNLKPVISAQKAARSLIERYGGDTMLYAMPDECFDRITALGELVSLAGEEGSPRRVINDWNCWNLPLADFCEELLCRVYLLHGKPL